MKMIFMFGILLVWILSFAGGGLTQEKVPREGGVIGKAAVEKSVEVPPVKEKVEGKKQRPVQLPVRRIGGIVTALDMKAQMMTVHQETAHQDRVMKLKLKGKLAKELVNLKPGDLVNLWMSGQTVRALKKVD